MDAILRLHTLLLAAEAQRTGSSPFPSMVRVGPALLLAMAIRNPVGERKAATPDGHSPGGEHAGHS